MSDRSRKFPHIYLSDKGKSEKYTRPPKGGGDDSPPPLRDRVEHAQALELSIGTAIQQARQQMDSREPGIADEEKGFYLEFQILADGANAFQQLGDRTKKIELVAVKKIPDLQGMVTATVFVPETAAEYFLKKVRKYRDEETEKGKPKNEALISRLETVQIGTVKSLFTDDLNLFPEDGREVWWEIWLRQERSSVFEDITRLLNIRTKPHAITFPEREIVLVMSNVEAMARLIANSDAVAELRIAKDIPSIFLEMGPREQADWAENLAKRLIEPGEHAVAISLLDSGATQIHPLLALGLAPSDLHTVEPAWGKNDSPHWRGHGTAMAGIALYADYLLDNLATDEPVKLLHRIESVKILPTTGQNDPELYGAITEQGVSLPEIQAPHRRRLFCMAVTSGVGSSDRGMPSSWSAAMDKLCFNDNEFPRLMIISVGNIQQEILPGDYPNINDLETVENPAQAWNPLIVGAYTEKVNILDPTAVAS
jgi:hypothetical protein